MAEKTVSTKTPVVRDIAAMLEKRCRRTADHLEVDATEVNVQDEWSRVAKQLARPEVVTNVLALTKERLAREPGTIRPRKVE